MAHSDCVLFEHPSSPSVFSYVQEQTPPFP